MVMMPSATPLGSPLAPFPGRGRPTQPLAHDGAQRRRPAKAAPTSVGVQGSQHRRWQLKADEHAVFNDFRPPTPPFHEFHNGHGNNIAPVHHLRNKITPFYIAIPDGYYILKITEGKYGTGKATRR